MKNNEIWVKGLGLGIIRRNRKLSRTNIHNLFKVIQMVAKWENGGLNTAASEPLEVQGQEVLFQNNVM